MELLKLNNIQANKITGIYENIWAIEPIYIEDNFWVIKIGEDLVEDYGILKRHLKKLLSQGKITVIDMSIASPERTKITAALKKETREQRIEYKGKYITTELTE